MSFSRNIKSDLLTELPNLKQSQKSIIYNGIRFANKSNAQIKCIMGTLYLDYCNSVQNTPFDTSHTLENSNDFEAGLFLRGIFIACGTISDPPKEYYLEFSVNNQEKCGALNNFFLEHGMQIKVSTRKNTPFLYTGDSESIEDILTYLGAGKWAMEIMNVKILKDVRNNVNRAVNCESANIDKTISASSRQIMHIEYIFALKGENYLDHDLLEVAIMRKNNPDLSLSELSVMLGSEISRSGVNHRLKKIEEIANSLGYSDDNKA